MKAKLSKRSFKWLMLSTLIPATLASACSDNTPQSNNKNISKNTSSDTKSDTDQNLPNADQPAQDSSSKLISTTPLAEKLKLQETRFDNLNFITNLVEINKGKSPKQQASAFWDQHKNNLDGIVQLLDIDQQLAKEYTIHVLSDNLTFIDNETGSISDLLVIFKKGQQFQPVRFYLSGFQSESKEQIQADPKLNYLTQNSQLSDNIKALYPSFLALMLYYADNSEYPESQQLGNYDKLNYYDFLNQNTDYFTEQSVSFNKSLLKQLFKFGAGDYHVKVVGIQFSDLDGTLGLKMRISDDAKQPKQLERTFHFEGLRKLDSKTTTDSVLGVKLSNDSFIQVMKSNKAIQKVLKDNQNNGAEFDVFSKWSESTKKVQEDALTNQLFNKLAASIKDSQKVYKDTTKDFPLSTLIGLSANAGIYPFYTTYSASSTISSLTLNVTKASTENNNNKNLTVSFKVSLPITVVDSYTTINDIYSSNSESLVFDISVSVPLSSILTSSK